MPRVSQTMVDQWRNHMPYCIQTRNDGLVLFNREYEIIYGESNLCSPRLQPDTFLYTDGTQPWRLKKDRLRYFRKLHDVVGNLRFSNYQITEKII